MSSIDLQQLLDDEVDKQTTPLNAQIVALQASLATAQTALTAAQASLSASQAQVTGLTAQVASLQAQIATLSAQVADLQAQLVVPVPSPANTGYRGPLGTYSAGGFATASDVTIQSMQVTPNAALSIPGANVVMKNCRFNASSLQQLNIPGAGFVAEDTAFSNVAVTGRGTFTRCNFGSGVTLNGVSVVKDSYVKGTLTTFAGSTLTNNTVVP